MILAILWLLSGIISDIYVCRRTGTLDLSATFSILASSILGPFVLVIYWINLRHGSYENE